MQLVFEQIRSGGDRNFGYLIGDRAAQRAVVIDPSYSPDAFVDRAREQGLQVTHIINTHGHPDHVNGNARAVELTGAILTGHPLLHPDAPLADGAEMALGALRFRVLHVPGHAADHIVIYELSHRLLITGDLLFVGKVGGTATDEAATTEWHSLRHLLAHVHDDATVWPGHDYGVRPSSTVSLERRTNPFLLCPDLEAFLALKKTWASFKKEYGLK
jgi:glyoxylase-like metal-dependent hydrolase (beta-lactamase superfamily II)